MFSIKNDVYNDTLGSRGTKSACKAVICAKSTKISVFAVLQVLALLDGKNVAELAIMSAKQFPLLLSIISTHLIDLCNKK